MSTDAYTYFKKWRVDREAGKGPRLIPSGRTVEHLRTLVAAGVSQRAIAGAAGISPEVVSNMLRRPRPTVQVGTERRILEVTVESALQRRNAADFVLALGARRRIRALLAIGWSHRLITERMTGGQISALVLNQKGRWISRATHEAIVEVYEGLCMTPGPSAASRTRAMKYGYAPPLAWDEGTLDDPQATPELGEVRRTAGRPGLDLDEWALLVRSGEDPQRAAGRCGVGISAVARAASRAGRHDLFLLAERATQHLRRTA